MCVNDCPHAPPAPALRRAWKKNYDVRLKDRVAATGQAAYAALVGGALAPAHAAQPPQQHLSPPEEEAAPHAGSDGEENDGGAADAHSLSLLAAAAAATAAAPPHAAATPTPPPIAAPAAKRPRCALLDELLNEAALKRAARLAGGAARAAGGAGGGGMGMHAAQPKRPHGKPPAWVLRSDAPALLSPDEFRLLSTPALQRLWSAYYKWVGAGERGHGSKSGNRNYLQRKLVAS